MARACRFSFGDRSGAAGWSFDGSYLTVMPEAGAPLSVPLAELAGIAGDGYTLILTVTGAAAAPSASSAIPLPAQRSELILSHLGADGPTLLEQLRREWLPTRAEVLRLGGSGEGKPFAGRVSGLVAVGAAPDADSGPGAGLGADSGPGAGGLPEPFQTLMFEDVLVIAREGRDLDPLFLALFGTVTYDDPTYTVRARQWPGQEVVFSKLAGRTEDFLDQLRANRELLAEEATATLAAAVPRLPSGPRAALAGMWLPGRLMELPAMDAVCPGFADVFRREWLLRLPRAEEGAHLLDWAASGSAWLACSRGPGVEADGGGATGNGATNTDSPLWMLVGKDGVWFLEALSIEDRATYCFTGGDEVPALVSRLLCAPQFSREALYSPLSELTGESAELAIAAQHLAFLVELRSRFRDRVIHQALQGWQKEVARLGKGPH